MGWAIGFDSEWMRDVGYGVPAYCDFPGCGEEIDRGLANVCGAEPYGGERGCGLFFCEKHQPGDHQRCERCEKGLKPFRPTRDHPSWIAHKLRDESWAGWREENPDAVKLLRAERSASPLHRWHRLSEITQGDELAELMAATHDEGIGVIARWIRVGDGWAVEAMDTESGKWNLVTGEEGEIIPLIPPGEFDDGPSAIEKNGREKLLLKHLQIGDTLTHTRCLGCIEEHVYTGTDGKWLCGTPTRDTIRMTGSDWSANDISPENVTHLNRVPLEELAMLAELPSFRAEHSTRPTDMEALARLFDYCPELDEMVEILSFNSDGDSMVLEVRGESYAWRHIITTEEIPLPKEE